MIRLEVRVKLLNKRKYVPVSLPDPAGIIGVVNEQFSFYGEEVEMVPNPAMGKWYKDRDHNFYWGGGLRIIAEEVEDPSEVITVGDNVTHDQAAIITPFHKRKIESVVNVFETGSVQGHYNALVKLKDYKHPVSGELMVQVTYGRSQTTEFGHLRALVQDYVDRQGLYSTDFASYVNRIGKMPSLATDDFFCKRLQLAGKEDPIMKKCQDDFFDGKYYQPAHNWFSQREFTLPLSLLVIYDSFIHSGGMLQFLRKRFPEVVPAAGGEERKWITQYVNVRHQWLANHSNPLLRNTIYRTNCFLTQIEHSNWDLSQSINAHGHIVN